MRSRRTWAATGGLAAILALTLAAAPSASALQYLGQWGGPGTAEGQFDEPVGVAADTAGNVYVADSNNHRVQLFTPGGDFIRTFGWGVDDGTGTFQVCTAGCQAGVPGSGDGQYNDPWGVEVAPGGDIYVGEFNSVSDRIQRFSPAPAFVTKWGTTGGAAESQFIAPIGIGTDASGDVYVADNGLSRIQKFTAAGGFLRMWGWGVDDGAMAFQICTGGCQVGFQGSGDGQLSGPAEVAVDSQGTIHVLDRFNNRVQQFSPDGAFLGKWGTAGAAEGQFNSPNGLAIDARDNVYVVDSDNYRVQQLTPNGGFVRMWGWGVDDGSNAFQVCTAGCQAGLSGSGDGQFMFPSSVTADCAGNVYVSDRSLARVQKFGEPGMRAATCPTTDGLGTDTDPPETTIAKGPKRKTKKRKAKFEFTADEPGSSFRCKLDKGAFEPCDAQERFKVKRRRHELDVVAVDPAGNVDPTPAEHDWKVKKKR